MVVFSRHLQEIIRAEDTLWRIGGEEFALVMPLTTWPEAKVLLERIRYLIEERSSSEGKKLPSVRGWLNLTLNLLRLTTW